MPVTSIASYISTLNQFVTHWTNANAELAAVPLTLTTGYALASLQTDRAALEAAIIALEPLDNARTNAFADRDIKKNVLRPRLTQFRNAVLGLLSGSIYVRSLTPLAPINSAPGRYLKPFDDMASLWTQINAAPPTGFVAPLVLPTGYTVATFTAELAALRGAYTAVDTATQSATLARARRDALLPNLQTRMKQYRAVVRARLPLTSPLLANVPAYSPPLGATPAPVVLLGTWDAASAKAKLSWTTPANTNISGYVIRYCPPPSYKSGEEQAVTSLPTPATTFETTTGLSATGSVAFFKVYVLTTQGGERGSNTVKIVRT